MRYRLPRTVLGAAMGLCWGTLAQAALPAGSAAQILSLQGEGQQRPAAVADWRAAQQAQLLAVGDYVRTREAARMALLLADDTQLRLHHNSVLQIKALAGADQAVTRLQLDAGRAWAQTRRANASTLELQTPAAMAAIRGTDWDIAVEPDGRTLLTVFSGQVVFANAQGQVSVGANEAALAEVGKAPVKLQLSQPRERVQWVNALQADPLPHLQAAPPPDGLLPVVQALRRRDSAGASALLAQAGSGVAPAWRAALHIAIDLQAGKAAAARQQLAQQLAQPPADAPMLLWLMQSDLQLMDGDNAAAQRGLRQALARWPQQPALLAQLAWAHMLADDLPAAHASLAQAGSDAAQSHAWQLVRAALARREGLVGSTLEAYTALTQQVPEDARGWLGLGSAQAEREDLAPARANLQRALELDAWLSGVQGERGTLETMANHFEQATAAFATALQQQPDDYVALTGQGLLRLKQGQPAAALDAFLRAGALQPRYARAKTWTAVAYYQLGRPQDAMATLQQAAALDDKDPMPWMLLAQIHTDLFQPGQAVQAARAALLRMPYLKSLNQLANDQKGSANLGATLAFFGLEDWALELAQQSYSPFWGASHLFQADRYQGEFNKNSALFRGFLTDPMAFGASQRHSSLLQQPGSHGVLEVLADHAAYRANMPSLAFNGLSNQQLPLSWFIKAQPLQIRRYPLDVSDPRYVEQANLRGQMDMDARIWTLGLGAQPHERLNLFGYVNYLGVDANSQGVLRSNADVREVRGSLGLSYRWSPTAQTWLKLGRDLERRQRSFWPLWMRDTRIVSVLDSQDRYDKQFNDVQLRHTSDWGSQGRWSVTVEHLRERQNEGAGGLGPVEARLANGSIYRDQMLLAGANHLARDYNGLTLEGSDRLSPSLQWDGALAWQQIRSRIAGELTVGLVQANSSETQRAQLRDSKPSWTPRLGLVWQPAPGQVLRLAYQDWQRPLSFSTLASTDTAGIPVADEFLQAGGRQRRWVAQWSQELSDRTLLQWRADVLRLNNPLVGGVDLRTPSLLFLEDLRNVQLVNLSNLALLEDGPSGFYRARLQRASGSVSQMFGSQWSGYAKYLYQHSRAQSLADAQQAPGLLDKRIPFVPRHTVVLGSTWVSSSRWYVSSRAVYRSRRFDDIDNLLARPAGWALDVMVFWESADKRWQWGAAALNLGGAKTPRQAERYMLDVRYRF